MFSSCSLIVLIVLCIDKWHLIFKFCFHLTAFCSILPLVFWLCVSSLLQTVLLPLTCSPDLLFQSLGRFRIPHFSLWALAVLVRIASRWLSSLHFQCLHLTPTSCWLQNIFVSKFWDDLGACWVSLRGIVSGFAEISMTICLESPRAVIAAIGDKSQRR